MYITSDRKIIKFLNYLIHFKRENTVLGLKNTFYFFLCIKKLTSYSYKIKYENILLQTIS